MPACATSVPLDAVVARPPEQLAYEPPADLVTLAACCAHRLTANLPLVDENDLTAFLIMTVLRGRNGVHVAGTEAAVLTVLLDLASGGMDVAGLARWPRARSTQRPPAG
jgi:prophage maintenance system killer protein